MGIKRRIGTSAKSSPKILSIEFLLQNHADIVGTIIVVITVGLIFEPTSKYATKFVALQHNTTDPVISFETGQPMQYNYGINDIFCVLFYCLVCIVAHGVVQQYLLDRSARKLHLSKIKHSKFNESGQLLTLYSLSLIWALELLRRDRLTKQSITETIGGPQDEMSYGVKLYFVVQIAYWLHCFPEFYLQRIRKEEISQRAFYVSLYLISFLGAYFFNITRITLVLVILHYAAEATFHLARLLYFKQSNDLYPLAFKIWNVTFVAARLISITLSVLVLALGLGSKTFPATSGGQATISYIVPSTVLRFIILSVIFALQIHLMWKYLVFHLGRMRPVETNKKETSGRSKRNVD